ncbi:hypothetical protein L6R21_12645 [bacterium]|nr:hypothetical protein [bacterium]
MRKASAGRATSSLHDPTVPEPKQAEALAKASKGAKENVTSVFPNPYEPEPKKAKAHREGAQRKDSSLLPRNTTSRNQKRKTTAHAKTQRYAKKILTSDFHEENK